MFFGFFIEEGVSFGKVSVVCEGFCCYFGDFVRCWCLFWCKIFESLRILCIVDVID